MPKRFLHALAGGLQATAPKRGKRQMICEVHARLVGSDQPNDAAVVQQAGEDDPSISVGVAFSPSVSLERLPAIANGGCSLLV